MCAEGRNLIYDAWMLHLLQYLLVEIAKIFSLNDGKESLE